MEIYLLRTVLLLYLMLLLCNYIYGLVAIKPFIVYIK